LMVLYLSIVYKVRVTREGTIMGLKGVSQDIEPDKKKRRLDIEIKYQIPFRSWYRVLPFS
jgi:hypothetical protein